jgi:transposase-like protein
MTLNGSGVRDVARVLHVSTATVLQELKKTRETRIGESEVIAAVGTRASGSDYLAG